MAERIIRQLIDDMDGTEILEGKGERIEFSLRGIDYQIDLSPTNIAKLDKAFKPYVDAAEKIRGTKGRRTKSSRRSSSTAAPTAKERLAAIREWARENGYDVSDRGRVKAEIVEAFDAAQ